MIKCFVVLLWEDNVLLAWSFFKPHYNSSIGRRLGKQAQNPREVSEIIGLEQNIPVHKSLGQT